MSNIYDNINISKVKDIQIHIENNADKINEIVNDIVKPYTRDLDSYVSFIKEILKDGESPPTVSELEDFCMNLSTDIYFASGMQEQLGIRDDIAKAVYKEVYNTVRETSTSGTIADKNTLAELASQQEYLTNVCYSRAYKITKSKVEAAQEILASCKKIISRRIAETELTRIGGN